MTSYVTSCLPYRSEAVQEAKEKRGKVLEKAYQTRRENYRAFMQKKRLQATSTRAKTVLDLIDWAEKEHITGKATDVSTNHNKYAWEE